MGRSSAVFTGKLAGFSAYSQGGAAICVFWLRLAHPGDSGASNSSLE
jgi:hypothetical protein